MFWGLVSNSQLLLFYWRRNFLNGLREGFAIEFDKTQQLTFKGHFKNDKRNGLGVELRVDADGFESFFAG